MNLNFPKTKFIKKFVNIDQGDRTYYGVFRWCVDSRNSYYQYLCCYPKYSEAKLAFKSNSYNWPGQISITKTGWAFKNVPKRIYPWRLT